MTHSSTVRLIASLTDANISGSIEWVDTSVTSIRLSIIPGQWITLPGTDGAVLLSDDVSVLVFEDSPPWHVDDDLKERIADNHPTHRISIGPRGGLRSERV